MIRAARPGDVPAIYRLIRELAGRMVERYAAR